MSENNLCDVIAEINNYYDSLIREKNRLLEEKRKVVLQVENQYQDTINILDSKQADLDKIIEKYNNILEVYSTFDIDSIGKAIAFIVSSIEEKDYIFQRAIHDTFLWHSYVNDGGYERNNNKICIVIEKALKRDIYSDKNLMNNCIKKLIKEEKAILLDESSYTRYDNYKVTFYNSITSINKNIDLSSFPYIKDFIDYVVQYRFDNNLINIDFQELNYLSYDFINNKMGKKKKRNKD